MSLETHIFERIQREGPISFADYMQMALYEPGYGYYVTGPAKMGWEGDFFTSTDVSIFFAHCVGRQLLQLWQQLGEPAMFHVLEQGSGRGHLAQGIQQWAEQEQPTFSHALQYRTADIRVGQDVRSSEGDLAGQKAHVILSNELVDAFPVHIVEKRGERLYEVFVGGQEGRLQEVLQDPSSAQIANYLDHYKIPWRTFADGWRAEINLAVEQWLEQSIPLLVPSTLTRGTKKHGFLLAIDYGDKAKELYSPDRERGTLSCYYQHQLAERPLLRPGQQDITAHVNFSALIAEGRKRGMHLQTYITQRQWLLDLGINEELERLRASKFAIIDQDRASDRGQAALFQWYNLRQRVQALTDPYGMGNFKVLLMHR
jgi:SAM-dependent MidA family methyltransferase